MDTKNQVFIETEELEKLINEKKNDLKILCINISMKPEDGDAIINFNKSHIPGYNIIIQIINF